MNQRNRAAVSDTPHCALCCAHRLAATAAPAAPADRTQRHSDRSSDSKRATGCCSPQGTLRDVRPVMVLHSAAADSPSRPGTMRRSAQCRMQGPHRFTVVLRPAHRSCARSSAPPYDRTARPLGGCEPRRKAWTCAVARRPVIRPHSAPRTRSAGRCPHRVSRGAHSGPSSSPIGAGLAQT